jgi:hypothetical protein
MGSRLILFQAGQVTFVFNMNTRPSFASLHFPLYPGLSHLQADRMFVVFVLTRKIPPGAAKYPEE